MKARQVANESRNETKFIYDNKQQKHDNKETDHYEALAFYDGGRNAVHHHKWVPKRVVVGA